MIVMDDKLKIASHNSCSGEPCGNLISYFVIPFARCQSKTIDEQITFGVRMFDLRAKKVNGHYYPAHGCFRNKIPVEEYIKKINSCEDNVYATITYEGSLKNDDELNNFKSWISYIKDTYTHIHWGDICIKKPWTTIIKADPGFASSVSKFKHLDGSSWHTYLPIPWLWDKIYSRPHEFDNKQFTYYDFV
jgi:hypothetical protein